jgi:hypothetical protein
VPHSCPSRWASSDANLVRPWPSPCQGAERNRVRRSYSRLFGTQPVAEKSHKLAALRRLSERMSELEKQRRDRLEHGDNPAEADRDAAQLALTDVVAFFLDHGIQSEPLVRLLSELAALSAGSSPAPMLAPRRNGEVEQGDPRGQHQGRMT